MGKHKLLLPWGKAKVIDAVLKAWTESKVEKTLIVVRSSDKELQTACQQWPVEILIPPKDPEDMKASVRFGIHHLRATSEPTESDALLVAPADIPMLSTETINRLVEQPRDGSKILVPKFGDQRGQPTLFPWPLTPQIFWLKDGEGLNALVERSEIKPVGFPANQLTSDMDTPQDYESLRSKQ